VFSGSRQATIGTPVDSTVPQPFTIALAPLPENGPRAGLGLSTTNRPTFTGTAAPFAIVRLTARRAGVDAPLSLGEAVADGSGRWTLGTGPLAEGVFFVTATVTPPGAAPISATNPPDSSNPSDRFVVDTSPPALLAIRPMLRPARVFLTLGAGVSGLDPATLTDVANYSVSLGGVSYHPTAVTVTGGGTSPAAPTTVELIFGGVRWRKRQLRTLTFNASGVAELAGKTLQVHGPLVPRVPSRRFAAHGHPVR
jgi:hypothetical protein